MKVDDNLRQFMFNMRVRRHKSWDEMAEQLRSLFDEPITVEDTKAVWAEMTSSGWLRNRRNKNREGALTKEQPMYDLYRLQRANVMHLLDLKRAGHTPRLTEYVIGRDGVPRVINQTAESRSYCGSSSASCADHA